MRMLIMAAWLLASASPASGKNAKGKETLAGVHMSEHWDKVAAMAAKKKWTQISSSGSRCKAVVKYLAPKVGLVEISFHNDRAFSITQVYRDDLAAKTYRTPKEISKADLVSVVKRMQRRHGKLASLILPKRPILIRLYLKKAKLLKRVAIQRSALFHDGALMFSRGRLTFQMNIAFSSTCSKGSSCYKLLRAQIRSDKILGKTYACPR